MYLGRFIEDDIRDVNLNLSLDHAIFELQKEDYPFTLRIWQNPPSVILGRTQRYNTEVNQKYCTVNNIQVSRRISGGGAVYHDDGNYNISLFFNRKLAQGERDIISIGKDITSIIVQSLQHYGLDPVTVYRDTSVLYIGKKISGSASHTRGNWILHHFTLLVSANLQHLEGSLLAKDKEPREKTGSYYYPTINIEGFGVKIWIDVLKNYLSDSYKVKFENSVSSNEELDYANRLKEELYSRDFWIKLGKRKLV